MLSFCYTFTICPQDPRRQTVNLQCESAFKIKYGEVLRSIHFARLGDLISVCLVQVPFCAEKNTVEAKGSSQLVVGSDILLGDRAQCE